MIDWCIRFAAWAFVLPALPLLFVVPELLGAVIAWTLDGVCT